jgi:uncharacterized protein (DUF1697 family)
VATKSRTRRYVLLLRGINLGGHNKVPMADLREIVAGIGCTDVATYIQSGNVIASSTLSANILAGRLESALDERFGFRPRTMVRTGSEIAGVLAENPFADLDPNTVHVGFLGKALGKNSEVPSTAESGPDRAIIIGAHVYLYYPNGMGRSTMTRTQMWRAINDDCTVRNLRTVNKLAEMAEVS